MLDIFQTGHLSETRQSEFAHRPETTTFGNAELSRTATCRHLLKAHHRRPDGARAAPGLSAQKITERDGRETWTQRLTTARANARSRTAPADTGTATGGQSTSISEYSIRRRRPPIRWAKRSTMPRNSRAS